MVQQDHQLLEELIPVGVEEVVEILLQLLYVALVQLVDRE
jgi:hypothetical protein